MACKYYDSNNQRCKKYDNTPSKDTREGYCEKDSATNCDSFWGNSDNRYDK